jgi:serine/threonine protein kinase
VLSLVDQNTNRFDETILAALSANILQSSQAVSADDTELLMQVNGTVVDLLGRKRKLPVKSGDVGMVTLKLRPIGMHAPIVINQLLILMKQLLLTLKALHKQEWVHRDIRIDNLVHGPNGWVLIDWELAGPVGQPVFWNSTYLPSKVNAGQMPYTTATDLWQVGRLIQRFDTLSAGATKHFAN